MIEEFFYYGVPFTAFYFLCRIYFKMWRMGYWRKGYWDNE